MGLRSCKCEVTCVVCRLYVLPFLLTVLFQNTNSSCVEEAEKLKRSKMKSSHEAKLERDRASRQAQQQKAQERKEKEKKRTQKQERRR